LQDFNLPWRKSELLLLLLLLLLFSEEVSVPTNGQSVVLAFWDYLLWRPEAFLNRRVAKPKIGFVSLLLVVKTHLLLHILPVRDLTTKKRSHCLRVLAPLRNLPRRL